MACHILSWNVAGFKTTLGFLDKFVDKGFEGWLKLQKADIVCIQEVKLSKKVISDEPKKYCATLPEYDSFWCFNDGSGGQRSGLNGVTTFARKGLTISANCAPLGDPELDAEGRCLMTNHGSFVIFNVYVPNAGNGSRLPFKQKWLRALRQAMQNERVQGRSVILIGDLNMGEPAKNIQEDGLNSRNFKIPKFLEVSELLILGKRNDLITPQIEDFVVKCKRIWPYIKNHLLKKQHKQISYKNAKGEMVPKWRVCVKSLGNCNVIRRILSEQEASDNVEQIVDPEENGGGDGDEAAQVVLGKPMWSEIDALSSYCVDGIWVLRDGTIVHSQQTYQEYVSSMSSHSTEEEPNVYEIMKPDSLSLDDVFEVLDKMANIRIAAKTQKLIENLLENDEFLEKAQETSTTTSSSSSLSVSSSSSSSSSSSLSVASTTMLSSSSSSRVYSHMKNIVNVSTFINEDNMIDSFRYFYPHAKGRATCWNQQMNCRYTNMGRRIDFALVDSNFFHKHVLKGPLGLDCGIRKSSYNASSFSEDQTDGYLENNEAKSVSDLIDENSREAALAACTLRGAFQAVPMTGGGIIDSAQWCYDHHFRDPGTGLVYTPPQYSDHIAINVLLDETALSFVRDFYFKNSIAKSSKIKFDSCTKRCQPHASTTSITSFFGKKSDSTNLEPSSSSVEAIKRKNSATSSSKAQRPKTGILKFFDNKGN